MKISKLHFQNRLPARLDFKNSILLFDPVLQKQHGSWIRRFPMRLPLRGGESLKNLENFPAQIKKILSLAEPIASKDLRIVAFGGGSIGDFAGFVASVLRRGVGLTQVPSTWLAAMDSAHGGKTALNVSHFKNQIGSFYAADDIFLVAGVLKTQPQELIQQAAGEYYKMVFLDRKLSRAPKFTDLRATDLWQKLPAIVRAKWSVVKKDPYESKGIRQILNLGHTVGHVLETALGLSHGQAVHFGLLFSVQWSKQQKIFQGEIPFEFLPAVEKLAPLLRQVQNPRRWLARDKKISKRGKIRFVFVRKPGYPLVKEVALAEVVTEWNRQSR